MLGVNGTVGLGEVTKPREGSSRHFNLEAELIDVSQLRDERIQKVWGMAMGEHT